MTTATTRPSFLARASSKPEPRPFSAVIYGPPGVGKTSFAAQFQSPIFLCDHQEDGIADLQRAGVCENVTMLPLMERWEDVLTALDELATAEHNYKTIVCDAMGGLERLRDEKWVQDDAFRGDWSKYTDFARGSRTGANDWRLFLNKLDKLRNRGMAVVLLAHSAVTSFKNPDGEDYDRYQPDVSKPTWQLTHRWASMVLFLNYLVFTDKDRRDLTAKPKAKGGVDRVLYTSGAGSFEAKIKGNIPHEIVLPDNAKDAFRTFASHWKASIKESK